MTTSSNHPDVETVAGLVRELIALLAGRAPHALDDDAGLDGMRGLRLDVLSGGIATSFGVQVAPSQLAACRTAGELANAIATAVCDVLRARPAAAPAPRSRRVLIIGSGFWRDFVDAAERRGWRAAIMADENTSLRIGTLGAVDLVDVVDWSNPIAIAGRIAHLYESGLIDRVVAIEEFGLLPAALATTRLGIPGPSLRAVRNTRDKALMRRLLDEVGRGDLRHAFCRDTAEARAFLESVGGAIIVKPVSGTGSDGVVRVTSPDELDAAFAVAGASRGFSGVLCEEFADGPEVSLEGYCTGGRFVPVALTDKQTNERFVEIGHQQPSAQPAAVFEEAARVAAGALEALGVNDAVTHTEFRITTRGPVLIETHTRMGGDSIHVLTRLTTGVDLADLMIAFGIGDAVDARPEPQGHAAAVRFFSGVAGRVSGVRLPPLTAVDGIHAAVGPAIGKVVSMRSASPQRLGHVIAIAETPSEAGARAEAFIERIGIEYFEAAPAPAPPPQPVARAGAPPTQAA